MARESSVMKMVKYDYLTVGLNIESTYKKTETLLKMYRKINWCLDGRLDEIEEINYESSFGGASAVSYLLNFAPDTELEAFRTRAENIMQTRILIDLIDKAVIKIRDYPETGKLYYDIFDLKYLSRWSYTEEDILEMLNLERSTYYRKKKEATCLLGYILFGFVMPEYIRREEKVAQNGY